MTPTETQAVQTADTLLAQAAQLLKQAANTLEPHRDHPDIHQAYALIPHSPLRLAHTWLPGATGTRAHRAHNVGAHGRAPSQEA